MCSTAAGRVAAASRVVHEDRRSHSWWTRIWWAAALEVCYDNDLDAGGSEARWCAGEVILVSDGTNIPIPGRDRAKYKRGEAVMMRWDADKWRGEKSTESAARLLPSMWNPKQGCPA